VRFRPVELAGEGGKVSESRRGFKQVVQQQLLAIYVVVGGG
jgi:hypothetical protein